MDGTLGRLVIITGMSGAGKSTALRCFEDLGYCCLDNLPPSLIKTFLQLYSQVPQRTSDIAIVCDVRSGELFSRFREEVDHLLQERVNLEVIFLDSADATLVTRFKETRRMPPMSAGQRVEDAVARERRQLDQIKELATTVIDTSQMRPQNLRDRLLGMYSSMDGAPLLSVTVLSFGFKYGTPSDADFVLDCRFLPNPFYEEELRELTGNDAAVQDYVMGSRHTPEYMAAAQGMLKVVLPHYRDVHKYAATVAMGCTGGRHRSVALANHLGDVLERAGFDVVVQHRDIERV